MNKIYTFFCKKGVQHDHMQVYSKVGSIVSNGPHTQETMHKTVALD